MSIEVTELARSNGVYLLCLPSHTTHILQPLDVGVFKSLKASFYKACKRYLATNPGRVITPDVLASFRGEAWPESVTPMHILSGFIKCGIDPLNPGEVTNRQLTRKKVLTSSIGRKVGGLPLCWKAFSENPTPHQQHWAASRCHQATTLYAIGRCHPSVLMFKMSFSPENRESIVAWVNKL